MNSVAAPLPHSSMDTSKLGAMQAEQAWREAVGVMFDTRPSSNTGQVLHAKVEAHMFGELALGVSNAYAQQFDRSRVRIGRDGLDHFLLQFYVDGHCGRRDTQKSRSTQPGDLLICDLAQPLATATSSFRNLTLVVPRRLLTPLIPSLEERHLNIISDARPMTGLLRKHLQALHQSAPHLCQSQAHALIAPTLQLAAAAIQDAVHESTQAGVEQTLAAAMARHAQAQLHRSDLSAQQVAAHFGISVRKLCYLFESRGGFSNYVQKLRLERCRVMLTDPEFKHLSLANIAERHGFSRMESFSRAFRRQFGISARSMRALGLAGAALPLRNARHGSAWPHWISEMR